MKSPQRPPEVESEPVRILYSMDSLCSGGAERQAVELVTRLDRARFEPRVVSLHGQVHGMSSHFLPRLTAAGISVDQLDLGWTALDIVSGMIRLARVVREYRPALVHTSNHHSNHITRLARVLMPRGLRFVVGIRTDYNQRQIYYERIEHRLSEVLVVNSRPMLRKLCTGGRVPVRKVRYIPNGLDVDRFAANPDPGLRKRICPEASFVVAMLGRITEQKSQHLLGQALGLLKAQGNLPPGLRALVVGEQDSTEIQEALEDAVRMAGLAQVVLQFPSSHQPEAYYHAVDVTVLPSLWEGMPNVVLESMAAGRPVIISEAANATEIIRDGVTGWVVRTGDVEHLADTLRRAAMTSPDQLGAMGQACVVQARTYSMSNMVDRYARLYDEVLSQVNPIPDP